MNNAPFRVIDTSEISLPEDIESLTEILAMKVHDVWGEMRKEEGWELGKERNDIKKTQPCLIPYENLPENEKDYDRKTAIETIKTLLALGYKIVKEQK